MAGFRNEKHIDEVNASIVSSGRATPLHDLGKCGSINSATFPGPDAPSATEISRDGLLALAGELASEKLTAHLGASLQDVLNNLTF